VKKQIQMAVTESLITDNVSGTQQRSNPHPATNAQCADTRSRTPPSNLPGLMHRQPRSTRSQRMTKRDRSAMHIHERPQLLR
jgi:hypothetical protein